MMPAEWIIAGHAALVVAAVVLTARAIAAAVIARQSNRAHREIVADRHRRRIEANASTLKGERS